MATKNPEAIKVKQALYAAEKAAKADAKVVGNNTIRAISAAYDAVRAADLPPAVKKKIEDQLYEARTSIGLAYNKVNAAEMTIYVAKLIVDKVK